MTTIPEPGDRSMVTWMNGNSVPVAVYVRIDNYSEQDEPELRWYNADEERGLDYGPDSWRAVCERMNGCDGPWQLTVGLPLHRQRDTP